MSRRRYVFTLNNPTCDEFVQLWSMDNCRLAYGQDQRDDHDIRYVVWQSEVAPTTNTYHYQGYVEFTKKINIRIASSKICGSNRCHLEFLRGTQAQAIAYAKKDDTRSPFYQWGEGGIKARPSSIARVVEQFQSGLTLNEVKERNQVEFLLHKNKINQYYLDMIGPRRDEPPELEVFYGKTGTGKSCMARLENPDYFCPKWPCGGRWFWHGYTGQKCLLLDEFCGQLKIAELLTLLDRYEYCTEYKGGNNYLAKTTTKIVMTSNIPPSLWYPKAPDNRRSPLCRRINEFGCIYDFEEDRKYPNFVARLREQPLVMKRPDRMEVDTENIQPLSQNTRDNMNQYNRSYET